jgi:hypothetical protein
MITVTPVTTTTDMNQMDKLPYPAATYSVPDIRPDIRPNVSWRSSGSTR